MNTQFSSSKINQSNFYDLKNEAVALVPAGETKSGVMSIVELEAMRTRRPAISASKHGLETVCGASCETGAQ